MTVGELLDDIREKYLRQLRQSIVDVERAGMRAIAEVACRDEHGALVGEGDLVLPLRLDILGVASGEVKETFRVDSDSMHSFQPIEFEWSNSVLIRLAPFHWDSCRVRASGIDKVVDWSRIRGWFEQWFDGEDIRQPSTDGLSGVIHFLSDPQHEDTVTVFEVDFGSAPVAAFEEFLDVLCDSGATEIEIGRYHELR